VPTSLVGLAALTVGLLCTLLPVAGSLGGTLRISILFVAFFTVCFTCFRNPSAWLARRFSWTPLRWLGNMSYSYYLLHGLALKAGFLALSKLLLDDSYGSWFFWLMLPPLFIFSLLASAALFLLVERPFSFSPRRTRTSARDIAFQEVTGDPVKADASQAARRLP